ncbi:hypothetical protein ACHAWF_001497 [Thalassiosira exigua]
MEDVRDVLGFLGAEEQDDVVGRECAGGMKRRTMLHARDRSNATFATSPILARLSSNDCLEETIRWICDLYCVGVVMAQGLGLGGDQQTDLRPVLRRRGDGAGLGFGGEAARRCAG